MYSKRVQGIFSSKKIVVGDRIRLKKGRKVYEGTLMPRPGIGDADILVIKLDNGYNLGVGFGEKDKLEKISAGGKITIKEPGVAFSEKSPLVTLLATGGTIASRVDYRTGAVSAAISPEDLLRYVPELADIVNLKLERPFNKMSEDMDHRDWQVLARETARALNSGSEGVIITHGTDSLAFTSAALSFMLKSPKPVVLTAAQKSSDRGSSDAAMNLLCSAIAATGEIAEIGICMHGTMNDDHCLFIRGTRARKMNTVRRDAFRPINDLPLAKIWPDGKVQRIHTEFARRGKGKAKVDSKFEPKVALLKAYPGSDPSIMDYLISKGYKGFVVEAMGLGHVPTNTDKTWISSVKAAADSDIPVFVCSQTLYGRVNPNVYSNLRTLFYGAGAIPGEDMLAETAYVKLGWVLGHTKSLEKARKMMLANYAGEISPRTLPDTYLY
jgi:glutamyl-tRNA(Gln) amidotransferase subunit D